MKSIEDLINECDRYKALAGELAEAVTHLRYCRHCGEDDASDCENGGREALAALAKYEQEQPDKEAKINLDRLVLRLSQGVPLSDAIALTAWQRDLKPNEVRQLEKDYYAQQEKVLTKY